MTLLTWVAESKGVIRDELGNQKTKGGGSGSSELERACGKGHKTRNKERVKNMKEKPNTTAQKGHLWET